MKTLLVALVLLLPRVAVADVVSTSTNGFVIRSVVTVPGTPAAVYAALVDVRQWWDKAHTYSGDSKNLTISATPGGCFCEALPGGGVQHGTVALAWPGQTLRIVGALGPLQEMGVSGAMTWQLEKAAEGTTVTFTYAVGGFAPAGFAKLAPLVDGVMAVQLKAFKAYADRK
jgi:uncharacterized protein YndB with AHSA1/START domain